MPPSAQDCPPAGDSARRPQARLAPVTRPQAQETAAALRVRVAQLESALGEVSSQYLALLEGLNDIVFTLDEQGRVAQILGNVMGILGRSGDDPALRSAALSSALVHPDDRGALSDLVTSRLAERSAASTLVRVQDVAGEYRWLDLSLVPQHAEEDGAFLGLRGVARDVTERIRAERVMASLNRAAEAIQTAGLAPPDVLNAVIAQLGEVELTAAVLLVGAGEPGSAGGAGPSTGPTPAILSSRAGARLAEALRERSPRVAPVTRELLRLLAEEPALHGRPNLARLAEGRQLIAVPMIAQNQLLGLLLVSSPGSVDVCLPSVAAFANQAAIAYSNAQLLHSLRESEGQYRSIFESVSDGLTIFSEEGTILEVNAAACRIYGYSRDELVGMHLSRLVHPDHYHGLVNCRAAIARDGVFHAQSVNIRKDGSPIDLEIRATAFTFQGRRCLLSVDTDVTERVASHRALLRAEKLRALGQMAGGVAHDFNNLLVAIRGSCNLALLEMELHPDTAREDLGRVLASTADAAEAVRRLQSLYRDVEDTSDLIPVQLDDLVGDVVALTQPRWKDEAQRDGHTVHVDLELGGPPVIMGNPGELRRVLNNLVVNALDAMPSGGTLTLRTAQEGDWSVVAVGDTGIGMTDAEQAQLFEPFYTTKGTAGSGLGLAMSLGIVERHGGRILVRSAPGQGSTFTVCIPSCAPDGPAAVTAAPALHERAIPVAPLTVLAVDDEPAVLAVLSRLLSREGHAVISATSGAEALGLLRERPFDLVITDLGMPGVSGRRVARFAREVRADVPVVLVTGWGETISPEQLREIGASALLAKPYAYEDLLRVVQAVTAGR
ncbi:MAG: PAS domain S-box protein [Chloroflexi bacterium]|nr:PAS domain S-box protein [Chloroflexota bacterium]